MLEDNVLCNGFTDAGEVMKKRPRLAVLMVMVVAPLALASGGGCGSSNTAMPDGATDATTPGTDGGLTPVTPDGGAGAADVAMAGTEPLTPTRRTSYRRITNFPRGPEAKFISAARISADGSTIIFATFAGTYTIASDGSNLVELSPKRNNGIIDISADGKKVVWYDDTPEGWVAGSDGSGKIKLPTTVTVKGLRMTAAGDQIYGVAPDAGGILKLPADGSGMAVIMKTEDVSKANGVDPNGNHWRGVIDISDDGSKVVFTFLWDAFAMAGDGSGLKQLTQFLNPENRTLRLVRISGNGAKVAWNVDDGQKSAVTFADWGGGGAIVYTGITYGDTHWMALSGDASRAVLGWGLRVLDPTKVAPYDALDSGSNSIPLGRASMDTVTANGKRACLVIEGQESTDQGRPNQLVVVDFDPPTTNGAPSIDGTSTTLRALPNDGSKRASVFARVTDPTEITEVNTVALRGGLRLGATPWMHWALGDAAMNGDVTAKDGIYSSNAVVVQTGEMVTPGPFTLRFVASNKAGHVLMVDTEGLEARAP
jgi:hypothetical protein